MKSSPSSVAGFTMTELLIVVAIFGILAAITIPSFNAMSHNQRVKTSSYELYTALSLTRNEAIKRNRDATLTVKVNSKLEVGWDITSTDASGDVTILNQDYIKGVAMRRCNLAGLGLGLTYGRNGRAKNIDLSPIANAPTFELYPADTTAAASPFTRCITLELSGMPRTRQGVCPPCP